MYSLIDKYSKQILITLSSILVIGIITVCVLVSKQENHLSKVINTELAKVNIGTDLPETKYVPSKSYFKTFDFAVQPGDYGTYTVFETSDSPASFIEDNTGASFVEEAPDIVITDANATLYDLADKYFICYYGNNRVSPILPLALANVETGGRADFNITWSALFPSKIIPIEYLYSMDVTTVISDESYYNKLSKEYSTRDRGALQMSPTYGTGDSYFNSMMSGTEVDKLSTVDTTKYSTWCNGASNSPGDRFYIPDVCLRLSSAYTQALSFIVKNNYAPESDLQLIAQLAMHHQQSAVWCKSDHSVSVGKWKSGELAYEYSKIITSQSFADTLRDYMIKHPDKYFIDADVAKSIFTDVTDVNMSDYATSTVVCTYPIKVLYAYIKLCTLY